MSVFDTLIHLARRTAPTSGYAPVDWVPLEPNSDGSFPPLANPLRGIRANSAGTVTVVTAAGEERVMNFASGETRLAVISSVVEATASGLEGAV